MIIVGRGEGIVIIVCICSYISISTVESKFSFDISPNRLLSSKSATKAAGLTVSVKPKQSWMSCESIHYHVSISVKYSKVQIQLLRRNKSILITLWGRQRLAAQLCCDDCIHWKSHQWDSNKDSQAVPRSQPSRFLVIQKYFRSLDRIKLAVNVWKQ